MFCHMMLCQVISVLVPYDIRYHVLIFRALAVHCSLPWNIVARQCWHSISHFFSSICRYLEWPDTRHTLQIVERIAYMWHVWHCLCNILDGYSALCWLYTQSYRLFSFYNLEVVFQCPLGKCSSLAFLSWGQNTPERHSATIHSSTWSATVIRNPRGLWKNRDQCCLQ